MALGKPVFNCGALVAKAIGGQHRVLHQVLGVTPKIDKIENNLISSFLRFERANERLASAPVRAQISKMS
jgi:hypothetical protein